MENMLFGRMVFARMALREHSLPSIILSSVFIDFELCFGLFQWIKDELLGKFYLYFHILVLFPLICANDHSVMFLLFFSMIFNTIYEHLCIILYRLLLSQFCIFLKVFSYFVNKTYYLDCATFGTMLICLAF